MTVKLGIAEMFDVCLSLLIEEIRKHKGPPVMNEQERCVAKSLIRAFVVKKKNCILLM